MIINKSTYYKAKIFSSRFINDLMKKIIGDFSNNKNINTTNDIK